MLLHVLVVHISHHHLGRLFTKRVEQEGPLLTNGGCKAIIK